MNFLFDENFPKAARPILEALGHQVFDLRQEGVRGSSDEMILRMAAEKSAVVLSTDRDFFHTLGRRDSGHRGIVVIALRQPNRAALIKRLEWFLDHIEVDMLPGRTFQLRDQTWMVYPPINN